MHNVSIYISYNDQIINYSNPLPRDIFPFIYISYNDQIINTGTNLQNTLSAVIYISYNDQIINSFFNLIVNFASFKFTFHIMIRL